MLAWKGFSLKEAQGNLRTIKERWKGEENWDPQKYLCTQSIRKVKSITNKTVAQSILIWTKLAESIRYEVEERLI